MLTNRVHFQNDNIVQTGTFRVLWPTGRFLSPKIRAFVDFMADNLVVDGAATATSRQAPLPSLDKRGGPCAFPADFP